MAGSIYVKRYFAGLGHHGNFLKFLLRWKYWSLIVLYYNLVCTWGASGDVSDSGGNVKSRVCSGSCSFTVTFKSGGIITAKTYKISKITFWAAVPLGEINNSTSGVLPVPTFRLRPPSPNLLATQPPSSSFPAPTSQPFIYQHLTCGRDRLGF